MSADAESLWNALTTGNTRRLVEQMRAASPMCTDTAHKPYMTSQGQEHAPHAGLGSVEAGPIVRYWTVRYEARGRTYFDHVIACDPWKAGLVVFRRRDGATSTQVVREIQRDEYEALTRSSP